ncbi:recombinase family protein [Acetobacter persici]|uniref:recombinase family protein n=1 Tax=Acetobacter persici TaxID=1076596 RepID=UPI001BAB0D6C|nr:recombinase family protein [Acetobacter persici]MBS1001460.1 recombinase family protein [Acetobacter persici]
MRIGYARTSTTDQTNGLAAQQQELTNSGCEKIFSEQMSAKTKQRPELIHAIEFMRPGDVLVVTKPDRLARSTHDLLALIQQIETKECGLVILSMGGTELDTTKPTSKLMLTMLAAVAEFERDIMLERQRDGIAIAKQNGKYRGRPPIHEKKSEFIKIMLNQGKKPISIAKEIGCSRATIYRVKKSILSQ